MTSSSKCRLTRNCPSLPLRAGTRSSFQLIADSRWLIVFCCCCSFLFFFVYFPCHCHSHSYPLLFRASLLRCCATERHNGHVTFSLSFSLWSFWSRHWSDPSIKPYQSPPTLFHFRSVRFLFFLSLLLPVSFDLNRGRHRSGSNGSCLYSDGAVQYVAAVTIITVELMVVPPTMHPHAYGSLSTANLCYTRTLCILLDSLSSIFLFLSIGPCFLVSGVLFYLMFTNLGGGEWGREQLTLWYRFS